MPRPDFARRLLRWFDASQRDLPWRHSRDPWAIWVSEIMLQQTRVEAVRAPFERFLRRYPNPSAFAAASDDDLLVAWRGLGYYRRARLLREGARQVTERHGGRVPDEVEALRALPGIGPYTLGAVASIAFGHIEVAVDGNVERVVARHRALEVAIGTSSARRAISSIVAGWQDRTRPGDFNQALMELGAVVCTPGSPSCGDCPVATDCVARELGAVQRLPIKKAPRAAIEVTARAVLVLRATRPPGARHATWRALGYRIPADQANGGQVELPGPGVLRDCDPDDLGAALRERFAATLTVGELLATVRHAITHHRITLHAHRATLGRRGRLEWFSLADETPWTTPSRKVFGRALGQPDPVET